ncbi:MAG TPA: acyl-CoA dehydrogenase family protein, partial [Blastocatellia bacterium]|nr:acyl-CoA dehydrogenase family protein [Blastocatellia bacterium]
MDFELNEEQQQIKQSIREFAEAELGPHVTEWDESQHFPIELQPKFADLGLMGVIFPEEYGGAGMGYVEYATIIEELARVDPAIALSIAAHNSLGAGHLYIAANEEQKQKYLAPMARGEYFGAWGLTEPSSGSDASSMRTTAVKRDSGWVLNGSKNFITNATFAGATVALAITDRTAGSHGISAFIIERGTKGFSVAKKENKLGMRASDTAALVFDDCFVPDANLIGEPGQGFIQAMRVLDGGRISIAALAVGIAQGAYEAALRYAKERSQFGRPIAEFQAIQFKLADMAT